MNICDHVSVSVKTVFCKETEKCSLKWVEGYFCFAFKFWIFSLKKSWNLEYKVTICCNKNDDHKKVVSPFNLIELWFVLLLKLLTKLRLILLEKLISILRKNYFEMQIGVQSKVCFSPLCHSLLTNILRFNVSAERNR